MSSQYGRKIDDANAAAALNGSEKIPMSQGGQPVFGTINQILAYINATITPLTESGGFWITVAEGDINEDGTTLQRDDFDGHTPELIIIGSQGIAPANYSFNTSTNTFTFSGGITISAGTMFFFGWRDALPVAFSGTTYVTVSSGDISGDGTIVQHDDFIDKEVELLMVGGAGTAPYNEDTEAGFFTFDSPTGTYTFYNGMVIAAGTVFMHRWRNNI